MPEKCFLQVPTYCTYWTYATILSMIYVFMEILLFKIVNKDRVGFHRPSSEVLRKAHFPFAKEQAVSLNAIVIILCGWPKPAFPVCKVTLICKGVITHLKDPLFWLKGPLVVFPNQLVLIGSCSQRLYLGL